MFFPTGQIKLEPDLEPNPEPNPVANTVTNHDPEPLP